MEANEPKPEAPEPSPRPSKSGVLLRAGVCLFLAFAGILVLTPLLDPLGYLLSAVIGTFGAAAIANTLALRIWERGHLADLGLYWNAISARHFGLGVAGGAGAVALILTVPLLGGAAQFRATEAPANWGSMLYISIVLLFGVVGEEILFRGYAFQIMVPVFGSWATILPMGVLFAAAHAGNLEVSNLALANTALWGVLLGYSVVRSGDLWVAIGLHFGWNVALPLFGVQVSGFKMEVTGYALEWNLAELWTGGAYGPEGGLLCTAIVVLLAAYVMRAPIQRQELPLESRFRRETEAV